uniref:Uncharacterized protein n=1 Tax=Hyaloperonospora arabidopsidis (strain Emoy2) TaxID=559515 RepID=M4B8T6_HYAAE
MPQITHAALEEKAEKKRRGRNSHNTEMYQGGREGLLHVHSSKKERLEVLTLGLVQDELGVREFVPFHGLLGYSSGGHFKYRDSDERRPQKREVRTLVKSLDRG